ncbi:unnamed protein product [Nezara viridula]|uniref:Uncharacterized protein n=1 Tax=Nezara viridula TaxID=85310 RepID=A0A9P0MUF6_NEZVI|nr:unnamed protein product [Nezara viridula]
MSHFEGTPIVLCNWLLPDPNYSLTSLAARGCHIHGTALNHPLHDPRDAIYGLTRRDQVLIFRLRTGHNRLKAHLFKCITRLHLWLRLYLKRKEDERGLIFIEEACRKQEMTLREYFKQSEVPFHWIMCNLDYGHTTLQLATPETTASGASKRQLGRGGLISCFSLTHKILQKTERNGLILRNAARRGKRIFRIATWNIRGLTGKENELAEEVKRAKVDLNHRDQEERKGRI